MELIQHDARTARINPINKLRPQGINWVKVGYFRPINVGVFVKRNQQH
jgi:hypothetical protein